MLVLMLLLLEHEEWCSADASVDGDGGRDEAMPGFADVRCDEDVFGGQSEENGFQELVGLEDFACSDEARGILLGVLLRISFHCCDDCVVAHRCVCEVQ